MPRRPPESHRTDEVAHSNAPPQWRAFFVPSANSVPKRFFIFGICTQTEPNALQVFAGGL